MSRIAKGRVAHLDVAAAEAHPGVVAVMTPQNAPKLAADPDAKNDPSPSGSISFRTIGFATRINRSPS